MMVDTGGIELMNNDKIAVSIREQAQIAIAEADVIVFVCDARSGITTEDAEVAKLLRQSKKQVVLAINKADTPKQEIEIYDFYNLGIGEPIPISAANHINLGDLLDAIVAKFPVDASSGEVEEDVIKVAIIGRPNVGKSSIFNTLVGETRSIVSDIAGTTRDAIDTPVTTDGQNFLFIDTAGMRRKGKIDEPIERYSIIRALRAVDRSDVVLIVINAVEGVTEQDKKIAGYAHDVLTATSNNLAFVSFFKVWNKITDQEIGLKIHMRNNIPLSRGLGSSSTAIVAGLVAANEMTGNTLTKDELVGMKNLLLLLLMILKLKRF